jgi:hypothetical protein
MIHHAIRQQGDIQQGRQRLSGEELDTDKLRNFFVQLFFFFAFFYIFSAVVALKRPTFLVHTYKKVV